jgi:hypothetical protein
MSERTGASRIAASQAGSSRTTGAEDEEAGSRTVATAVQAIVAAEVMVRISTGLDTMLNRVFWGKGSMILGVLAL